MGAIAAKGTVFSGEGTGSRFVGIAWARKQIREKLGFDPYLGTLNVRLQESDARVLRKVLGALIGIEITPEKGFFQARCFKALVTGKVEAAIVLPEKSGYPSDVLEVIAPVCLRRVLSLEDGDEVEITVFLDTQIKA